MTDLGTLMMIMPLIAAIVAAGVAGKALWGALIAFYHLWPSIGHALLHGLTFGAK